MVDYGGDGVIIDLTALNAVVVDKEASTVTVSGGMQIKDAVAPLFAAACAVRLALRTPSALFLKARMRRVPFVKSVALRVGACVPWAS